MKTTYYLRKLLFILHIFGLVRLPNFYQEKWKTSLHNVYWLSVHSVLISAGISFGLSLIIYSTRNIPEFLQRLFEIVSFSGYYIETLLLNSKLTQFLAMLDTLDRVSYQKGTKLLKLYKREEKIVCIVIFTVMTNTFICKYLFCY